MKEIHTPTDYSELKESMIEEYLEYKDDEDYPDDLIFDIVDTTTASLSMDDRWKIMQFTDSEPTEWEEYLAEGHNTFEDVLGVMTFLVMRQDITEDIHEIEENADRNVPPKTVSQCEECQYRETISYSIEEHRYKCPECGASMTFPEEK